MRNRKIIIRPALILISILSLNFAPGKKIGDDFLPSRGKINLLIILVNFPEVLPTGSREEIARMIFSRGESPKGSVADYFSRISGGKLEISGQVYGWFQLKEPEGYYANAHYGHQSEAYPRNSAGVVEEALAFADQAGVDFSSFDNSRDGAVDGLVILFSGPGGHIGAKKDLLWPWLSYLSTDGAQPAITDGVKIDRYITVSERNPKGGLNFLPIICHELGHLLGLPDLLDWNNDSLGIGKFGLMGFGNYGGGKAFWPEAWTRAYLGWNQVQELSAPGKYRIGPAESRGEIFRINTLAPSEYFLMENRQPIGNDSGLFGKGLAIYHIDEKVLTGNDFMCIGYCPEHHYLVSVLQADGLNHLERKQNSGDAGDFFPGAGRITRFNDATGRGGKHLQGAHSRLWNGELTGINLSGIKLRKEEISFQLKLNKPQSPDPFVPELRLYDYRIVESGEADGLLRPGEKFDLIPAISNQGAKAKKNKISLKVEGLKVERDEIAISESIKPGERIEIPEGFHLQVPESPAPAKAIALEITLQSKTEKFQKMEKINLIVGLPEIILLMDDDGLGIRKYYQSALQSAGAVFHTLEIKDSLPKPEFISQFKIIIWNTGIRGMDGQPALDQERQELIASLIDQGKNLILISPGLKLEEGEPLAQKLGIIKAEPGTGVKIIKSDKNPSQLIPLTWLYFPAITPCSILTPVPDSQVLYHNLQGDPIAISIHQDPTSDQTTDHRPLITILGFPLETLRENQAKDLLKELINRPGP